jgi:hypothetical protein
VIVAFVNWIRINTTEVVSRREKVTKFLRLNSAFMSAFRPAALSTNCEDAATGNEATPSLSPIAPVGNLPSTRSAARRPSYLTMSFNSAASR